MKLVTLLTDFGTADYYVAAVKGVLLSQAPSLRLVDISHQVDPGDIPQATFLLSAAAPTFPKGTVHLAVVDPGVGSDRRMLAVAASGQFFIAPDNGLLTPWVREGEAHEIDRPDLYRKSPGHTFHGRDRFAPAAAFLARGGDISKLGPPVRTPVIAQTPRPRRLEGRLLGRVQHVDRYGNLVTDLPGEWLDGRFRVARIADQEIHREARCYADLPADTAGLLIGSLGTVELSLNGASLARQLSVKAGARVEVLLRNEGAAHTSA